MIAYDLSKPNPTPAFEFERPYTCEFFCWGRPHMNVFKIDAGGNRIFIGKILDPCTCCALNYEVMGSDNRMAYHVDAPICQKGICCQCPCQECQRAQINWGKGDRANGLNLQPIQKIGKKKCCDNALSDADDFIVPIPNGSTYDERILMIALCIMIDYRVFESDGGNN